MVSQEFGRHFDVLFNNRQKGDYSDFVIFQAEDVAGWLKPTEEFIAQIDGLIRKIE